MTTATEYESSLQSKMLSPNGNAAEVTIAFRNIAQRYATRDGCISLQGSLINTGRYHIGRRFADRELVDDGLSAYRFGVLYLSTNIFGCLAEFEYYATKWPRFQTSEENLGHGLPRTFVGLKIEADRILDLTDEDTLNGLGILTSDLVEEWEIINYDFKIAKTQLIGKVAKEKGYAAIVAPSARWLNGKSINILDCTIPMEIINIAEFVT